MNERNEIQGDEIEEFEAWLDQNPGEDLPEEESDDVYSEDDYRYIGPYGEDDYLDGDHESALESVYGPND